jgi:nuclear GTP-binding protein
MVNQRYAPPHPDTALSNKQAIAGGAKPTPQSMAAVAAMQQEPEAGPSNGLTFAPIDSSLTRDSSSKAFMRELRKVIERSDVIIQVLDSRDPEGTRSRWVEEEVRKRDLDGKKLLAVMNKIGKCASKYTKQWG